MGVSFAPSAALATGFSLGYLSDLTRRSGRTRDTRIHASIAVRFESYSFFGSPRDLHALNVGGRVRLGGVHLKNFTYAAAGAYAVFGLARPECVGDQCLSFAPAPAGSLSIGSQWLVRPNQSFGIEAGVYLVPVILTAGVVYTIYLG